MTSITGTHVQLSTDDETLKIAPDAVGTAAQLFHPNDEVLRAEDTEPEPSPVRY